MEPCQSSNAKEKGSHSFLNFSICAFMQQNLKALNWLNSCYSDAHAPKVQWKQMGTEKTICYEYKVFWDALKGIETWLVGTLRVTWPFIIRNYPDIRIIFSKLSDIRILRETPRIGHTTCRLKPENLFLTKKRIHNQGTLKQLSIEYSSIKFLLLTYLSSFLTSSSSYWTFSFSSSYVLELLLLQRRRRSSKMMKTKKTRNLKSQMVKETLSVFSVSC